MAEVLIGLGMTCVASLVLVLISTKGIFPAPLMAFRALDITLFEIVLRDIDYWIGPDAPSKAQKIKINVVQPTELLYEAVEFARCKDGVEFGQTVSFMQNKAQLRRHFQKHPLKA